MRGDLETQIADLGQLPTLYVDLEALDLGRRYYDLLRALSQMLYETRLLMTDTANVHEKNNSTGAIIGRIVTGDSDYDKEVASLKDRYQEIMQRDKERLNQLDRFWADAQRVKTELTTRHEQEFPPLIR